MRVPFLSAQQGHGNRRARDFDDLRLRGGVDCDCDETTMMKLGCASCCGVTLLFGLMYCLAGLGPNTYGLLQNTITKAVQPTAYRGGLHFVGPITGFIQFPASAQTIEFSSRSSANSPPITAHAGGGNGGGGGGGGQEVVLSVAFQYVIPQGGVYEMYRNLSTWENAQQWFKTQSSNAVTSEANNWDISDYYKRRDNVADKMLVAVNAAMGGHAVVTMFELLQSEFNQSVEDSLTLTSVKAENRTYQLYNNEVVQVQQDIDVSQSEYNATIAKINAGAQAQAAVIRANASKAAFMLKQSTKAAEYKKLKDNLGFDDSQMTRYLKIKSLQAQAGKSKVVVGLESPAEIPPSPSPPSQPSQSPPSHDGEL